MTQQKNDPEKISEEDLKIAQSVQAHAKQMRERYMSLSPFDQQAINAFLNLHNAAQLFYQQMSKDAQEYLIECIDLSKEANEIEENEGALES